MTYDLCCIGHTTIDRVITPFNTVQMPGGTSFYFSSALAQMRLHYLLVTAMADADKHALDVLMSKGIGVQCLSSVQTLFFENIYGENPDQRRQRVLQQADPFTEEQLAALPIAAIYHLGALLADDFPPKGIQSLAAKGKVSLDVQGLLRRVENQNVIPADWRAKKAVLPFVHFLKANEEELQTITGCADITIGANALLQWGAKEVIITKGSKGSIIYTVNDVHHIPAFKPGVLVDATGCGDTYMAGYLFKRSNGAGIQDAGEFAAAMATIKLQHSGPFAGTSMEVEALQRSADRT